MNKMINKLHNIIAIFTLLGLMTSCNNNDSKVNTTPSEKVNTSIEKTTDPTVLGDIGPEKPAVPFIGTKSFETRPGYAGTGTPHKRVTIDKEGNVTFSFVQENQADHSITEGTYSAGKFQKVLKCTFKEWGNETNYYEITADKVYETDSNGIRLNGADCCVDSYDEEKECPCESKLFDI